MKYLTAGLLSIFLFANASYGDNKPLLKAAGIQEMNETAPDFSVKERGGKAVNLNELKGKVVLLHFWATWCKPCREEFPLFQKLHEEFKEKDFVLLPIAIDPDMTGEEINSFAKGLGASFPVYLAKEGKITGKYWTWGVPSTYFINREGRIVGRAIGPRDWGSEEVKDLIEGLLKEN